MEKLKGLFQKLGGASEKAGPAPDATDPRGAAQMILDFLGNAAVTTDSAGRVQYLNPMAERLTGWALAEAHGRPLSEVVNLLDDLNGRRIELPVEKVMLEGRTTHFSQRAALARRGGQQLAIEGNVAPIYGPEGRIMGTVLLLHDVSKSREIVDKLLHQANHDALTGLVNRREFETRARRALNNARVHNVQHALCYLDLDQFKIVNDTCGHGAGDELLRQIAALLQSQVRSRDTLARLGGDEFGLLLELCPLEEAERIAHQILRAVKDLRFNWQGKVFTVGVSIGICALTAKSEDIAQVLSATDSACYAAKEKGRNRVQVFGQDDRELVELRGEMRSVSHITSALDDNRFALFIQPIMPIGMPHPGQGDHYEVLVRMISPQGELVPPGQFIPAAERYQLMSRLDRLIIQNAFAAYRQVYPRNDPRRHTWAINLSGTSLGSEGLIEFIREQAAHHGVPPQAICFEITESAAISNVNKAVEFIWGLKIDGYRFALDDFGKGMSSFAYLKTLPVDYLKIDGEFVREIVQDKVSYGMVEAIHRIGQLIGLSTIAEYVENDAILEKLREIGVDHAQGYGVGKPCSLDLLTKIKPLSPPSVVPRSSLAVA